MRHGKGGINCTSKVPFPFHPSKNTRPKQTSNKQHYKLRKFRSSQFQKYVGGKTFYSPAGMHEHAFREVVAALQSTWRKLKSSGNDWSKADIDAAYAVAYIQANP